MSIQAVQPTPIAQGSAAFAPNTVVNPAAFYANTRRQRYAAAGRTAIKGIGSQDIITLQQSGIVAALEVRIVGSVVLGGTIGTTTASYDWPYNLLKQITVSANGVSNLYQTRGLANRAYEMITNPKLSDRGVGRTWSGGTTDAATQGSLSLSSEDWGTSSTNRLAPNTNAAATGTYTVDMTFIVPIAADQVSLVGSVYAQSQATNLTLTLQYGTQAELLSAVGASATVSWSALNYEVTALTYSIPNVGGQFVIPDLSQLHAVTETQATGIGSGTNSIALPGVGVGRLLMRMFANVYSSSAPLAVTDANFSRLGYRYGGNIVPEEYSSNGGDKRSIDERACNVDIGKLWGFHVWDFASEHALRDLIDQGQLTNLNMLVGLVSSPTSGVVWLTQEVLFNAASGA
jgi:hypothetical protein